MKINFHHHALERIIERGTSEEEVKRTVEEGEQFPAKFGRIGFRRNFNFDGQWRGKHYNTKQVEVYVVEENDVLLVITVITRFF